jgi:uncharacterized membrane protein
MLASFIALASSFFDQFTSSIIKKSETKESNAVSIWDAALISIIGGSLLIFTADLTNRTASETSIFTWVFLIRVVLELFQIYVTYNALKYAQLSSFNFVRSFSIVFTIALEIILLGTILSLTKYFGVFLIILSLGIVFRNGVRNVTGWHFLILSAINGGILNSLAKYQYTIGQVYAVESNVRIVLIAILLVVVVLNNFKSKSNVINKISSNKLLLWTIPFKAVTSLLSVVAINLGSATTYVAVERGGSVLFGVILGHSIFKEKSLKEKLSISAVLVAGIWLVAFS